MRGFVLVLFASIPLFGGSADISVTCDGVSVVGSGTASCSFGDFWTTGASAQASLTGMSVSAMAWAIQPEWGVDAGSSSATGVAQRGFYTDGYRWIWSRVRRTRVERWRRQLWRRRLGRCVRIAGRVLDERLGRNPSRRLFSDVSGVCFWRSPDAHSLRICRRKRGLFLWRTGGRWSREYE